MKNGKIIGRGWHERAGGPHAEIIALREANAIRKRHVVVSLSSATNIPSVGATLFVTLEPCHHHGKTPPCTHAIVKSGIKKVVIGMRDPNPLARGGAEFLRSRGIEIQFASNEIANECRELNQIWLKNLRTKLPYVTLKLALTADGSTLSERGKKWITSRASRNRVQKIRVEHDAILVGVNTIIVDDPRLTVRTNRKGVLQYAPTAPFQQPTRIVLDPHGRTPREARIFREPGTTIIVTRKKTHFPRAENLVVPNFQLSRILQKLRAHGLTSILVEGGELTARHFFEENLIDHIALFRVGRKTIFPKFGKLKIRKLKSIQMEKIGTDQLFTGFMKRY